MTTAHVRCTERTCRARSTVELTNESPTCPECGGYVVADDSPPPPAHG